MGTRSGFTLVELMIVVAILGILAAIAIPQYLRYMHGAKINAAIDNFENLARVAASEATKRNLKNPLDGPADVLAVVDPNYNVPAQAKKSPMDDSLPAYAQGAAPAGDGQVVIDIVDFTRAGSPMGTVVTICADTNNDGAVGVDRTCRLRLE